jgi:hypothetical protein
MRSPIINQAAGNSVRYQYARYPTDSSIAQTPTCWDGLVSCEDGLARCKLQRTGNLGYASGTDLEQRTPCAAAQAGDSGSSVNMDVLGQMSGEMLGVDAIQDSPAIPCNSCPFGVFLAPFRISCWRPRAMCRVCARMCGVARCVSWLRCVILHLGVLSFLSPNGRNPDAGVAAQTMGGHTGMQWRSTKRRACEAGKSILRQPCLAPPAPP